MQKFRGFFGGKDRFVIKIPVLTPKTRFSLRKEYFTSEIVFYSGNLSFFREKLAEIPGFFEGKDRCVIKIPVLTPKTRFSRRKEYFTSEIVFYSLNLSFCIEILQKFRVFSLENIVEEKKVPVLAPKRGFLEEKSTSHLK